MPVLESASLQVAGIHSSALSRSKPEEKASLAKFPSHGSYKDHILHCLKWEQTQNILQVLRMKQILLRKALRFLVQFPPSKAGETSGIPWCQDLTRPSQMPRFVLSSLCQQPTPQLNSQLCNSPKRSCHFLIRAFPARKICWQKTDGSLPGPSSTLKAQSPRQQLERRMPLPPTCQVTKL